jgi:3'-phosphoadenosine 5'-phosphosulfate (PAPS) 3'-phosphatase
MSVVGSVKQQWTAELETAIDAVREACQVVKDYYDMASVGVYAKEDLTPLTDADLAADRILRERIIEKFPGDALLTEEGADDQTRLLSARCWIADPLDGTKQFVERTGEFDVFLALVNEGRPVVGVACHPPTGQMMYAVEGQGAWIEKGSHRRRLQFTSDLSLGPARIATSHYHGAPGTLSILNPAASLAEMAEPVSLAIGFQPRAFIDPESDVPRYDVFVGLGQDVDGPNYSGGEWDFAAADLIIREAGGAFTDARGRRFSYNKPVALNFGGICAAHDPEAHSRFIAALATQLPQPSQLRSE